MKGKIIIFIMSLFISSIFSNIYINKIEYSDENKISVFFSDKDIEYNILLYKNDEKIEKFLLDKIKYTFDFEVNVIYSIFLYKHEELIHKESFFIARKPSKKLIIKGIHDFEVIFFPETFMENFDTFVFTQTQPNKNIEKIHLKFLRYPSDLEARFSNVLFPIGIKSNYDFNYNYINVSASLRIFNIIPSGSYSRYFPVITTDLTKSDYKMIFPSILSLYDPIIFSYRTRSFLDITINLDDKEVLSSYSNLWKVNIERKLITINRYLPGILSSIPFPSITYRTEDILINENHDFKKKKNAILFVHGMQYHNPSNFDNENTIWKKGRTMFYWNDFFKHIYNNKEKFKDFDFFEFIYDTQSKTFYEYSKDLSDLLNKSEFKNYEEIYIISHSMGVLVSRQAVNLSNLDNIAKIVSLTGTNNGSYLQNTPELFHNKFLERTLTLNDAEDKIIDLLFYLIDLNTRILPNFSNSDFKETLLEIFNNYPQLLIALFSESAALSPFKGGLSIRYDDQEFLNEVQNNYFSEMNIDSIFSFSEEIVNLNKNDKYLDKLILISTYMQTEKTDNILLFVNEIMKIMSDHRKDDFYLHENDGLVNLRSQTLKDFEDLHRIRDDNTNMTHDEVLFDDYIIKYVLEKIILNLDMKK